jgi:lysophospholipase L1-like esterase
MLGCGLAACGSGSASERGEPRPPLPSAAGAGELPTGAAAPGAEVPALADPDAKGEVSRGGKTPLDPRGQGEAPPAAAPENVPPDAAAPAASLSPVTLYLVGDSIVQGYADTSSDRDQAGWGQMLAGLFDSGVTIVNRAIGGRTARRFIDEGRLDDITAELEAGGFLLIQFGTNDGNRTATYTLGTETIPYFLDPQTDFKDYLLRYLEAARSRGVSPVLVTPTPRNSAYCTGGNGTFGHAEAVRELGAAEGVPVVDLNARSVEHLRAICPAPEPEDFFLLRPDGSVDGTHFQENGARILAGFVADELEARVPELRARGLLDR